MLVLLADVVLLAEVDQVDDGLCGEEEERVDNFDLANCKYKFADGVCANSGEVVVIVRNGRLFKKLWRY